MINSCVVRKVYYSSKYLLTSNITIMVIKIPSECSFKLPAYQGQATRHFINFEERLEFNLEDIEH